MKPVARPPLRIELSGGKEPARGNSVTDDALRGVNIGSHVVSVQSLGGQVNYGRRYDESGQVSGCRHYVIGNRGLRMSIKGGGIEFRWQRCSEESLSHIQQGRLVR